MPREDQGTIRGTMAKAGTRRPHIHAGADSKAKPSPDIYPSSPRPKATTASKVGKAGKAGKASTASTARTARTASKADKRATASSTDLGSGLGLEGRQKLRNIAAATSSSPKKSVIKLGIPIKAGAEQDVKMADKDAIPPSDAPSVPLGVTRARAWSPEVEDAFRFQVQGPVAVSSISGRRRKASPLILVPGRHPVRKPAGETSASIRKPTARRRDTPMAWCGASPISARAASCTSSRAESARTST
mmetsp:Transcript_3463/g.13727  ORF Transcript_3463/g.13727 Transcript_3463/m.13727 type:complete len:246 (-) Transcript_3463:566-1303(-)